MSQTPTPGCIVEFMQGDRPQLACVLEDQNGRLRLLTQHKRETKLPAARVLPWTGPSLSADASRQEMLDALETHAAKREALEAEVDAMELWELSQGEIPRASVQWFAELIWEDTNTDRLAALGRSLLTCKTHFKFQPPDFEIHPREKVEARLAEQKKARERESLVYAAQTVLQRLWEAHKRQRMADADELAANLTPEDLDRVRSLLMKRIIDPGHSESEQLWKAARTGLPEDEHLPLHLARTWGLVDAHCNVPLLQADYAPGDGWSEQYADDIDVLLTRLKSLHREPSPLPFVSIDSETTRDVDDALHVAPQDDGGFRLKLAIACPALAWDFESPLGKAVAHRATSIYLPEATYHMMPERAGIEAHSLTQDESRPAMVLDFDLGPDGTLRGVGLVMEWVRVAANLTYEQCEAVLAPDQEADEDNPAAPFAEQLTMAHGLARLLRERRLAAGAVIINRPDPVITLGKPEDPNADPLVVVAQKPPCPMAQLVVSETMILVNAGVAAWGMAREVPLLHRTQDIGLPKEHCGEWSKPEEVHQVVRSLGGSVLEVRPRRHTSLGVRAYSPSSSPLRRYPDLLNQAQLLHVLEQGSPRWTDTQLEDMLPLVNARLEAAGRVQRFRPRYWKLLYYKQQGPDALWPAVVVEENPALVSVALPDTQMFVRAPRRMFGDKIHPGQHFQVRLGKIDLLDNRIMILEAWPDECAGDNPFGEPAQGSDEDCDTQA